MLLTTKLKIFGLPKDCTILKEILLNFKIKRLSMNIKIIFLLLFISSFLYSKNILKNEYYIKNNFVMLSDIVNSLKKNDKKLFSLNENRHTLRVRTKELIKLLKINGYTEYVSKYREYIQFTKRSPINRKKLINKIKKLYKRKYSFITIKNISVQPNVYLEKLPSQYTIHFEKSSYLSNRGILYIKTLKRKKIFFHYLINAKVTIYQAKQNIKRSTHLENRNCQKKDIILDKFRAMPVQDINKHQYQSKYNIGAGRTITVRNVTGLDLVRRGSQINIFIDYANMQISFSAKALQNGELGQTINVRNREGKKMKVIVTGKNIAEVK